MKNGNEILHDIMVIFQQQNKIIVIATNIEIVKHVICLEHTHTQQSHHKASISINADIVELRHLLKSRPQAQCFIYVHVCFALHMMYGQVLRKDANDWVKKCMDYEVEGVRPGRMPNKTTSEVTEKDCQFRQICKEDAVDRRKWRKLVKDVYNSHKDRMQVSECFLWYRLSQIILDKEPLNGLLCFALQ